ncbi:hypothetical protein [Candidatus Magnetominusculus xianensis]|uniref:Secreted protein n=1 Tax=Candidatus Magnetominusculus xianensis TaxID=1748249 RepID=A0ABR5SEC4_9BACT|nr:hypothetical protein [Candidatus Magnetominusculus xianensis]KWT84191.1 hypothetical protein ASN18_1944 [Candidatus Magnetominusculus xianensis]MBF0405423.1 hypothetical protein [Nitrospirota bacterium]
MKRSLIYVLVLAVMLTALGMWGINSDKKTATAADTVSYFLPYLTTDTNAPVYCMVSNMATPTNASTSNDDNVTTINFTVLSNSNGNASRAAASVVNASAYKIAMRRTRLMTFSGQAITVDGSQTHDLTSDTGTGTVAGYGGRLDFIAASSVGAPFGVAGVAGQTNTLRSTFNCSTVGMACYQGTTSPKRNVVGYSCSDSGLFTGTATPSPIGGVYAY